MGKEIKKERRENNLKRCWAVNRMLEARAGKRTCEYRWKDIRSDINIVY